MADEELTKTLNNQLWHLDSIIKSKQLNKTQLELMISYALSQLAKEAIRASEIFSDEQNISKILEDFKIQPMGLDACPSNREVKEYATEVFSKIQMQDFTVRQLELVLSSIIVHIKIKPLSAGKYVKKHMDAYIKMISDGVHKNAEHFRALEKNEGVL